MTDIQDTNDKAPQDNGQAEEEVKDSAPSDQQDGQASEEQAESSFEIPEKFKGKSAEDIAKSYIALEKKLGERPRVDEKTQKEIAKWRQLGAIIENNPVLYKTIEDEVKRIRGESAEDTQESKPDDVRLATQSRIMSDFERDFGINQLPQDKRKDLSEKILLEVAEMYDPSGEKSIKEVINSIPLHKLNRSLEKAYRYVTADDREEQGRLEGLVEARQNSEATFGSIPSSSINSQAVKLTEDEKKVARRMGISEADYLKEKLALDK